MKHEWKYSPGPWEAKQMEAKGLFPQVQLGPSRQYSDKSGWGIHRITVNEGQPPDTEEWGNSMESCRANALLIAAAPELLEACIAVANTSCMAHFEALQLVRAAIKKAKG